MACPLLLRKIPESPPTRQPSFELHFSALRRAATCPSVQSVNDFSLCLPNTLYHPKRYTTWMSVLQYGQPATSAGDSQRTFSNPLLSTGDTDTPSTAQSAVQLWCDRTRLECRLSTNTGPGWTSMPGRQGQVTVTVRTDPIDDDILQHLPCGESIQGEIFDGNDPTNIPTALEKIDQVKEMLQTEVPHTAFPIGTSKHFESISISSNEDGTLTVRFADCRGRKHAVRADIVRLECFVPESRGGLDSGSETVEWGPQMVGSGSSIQVL